jgi:hypothetical protein
MFRPTTTAIGSALVAIGFAGSAFAQTCPQTSPETVQTGTTLETFANDTDAGVVYDGTGASLRLKRYGANFQTKMFAGTGTPQVVCAADFDKDGWVDFAGSDANGTCVGFWRNTTYINQAADAPIDWDNTSYSTTPSFTLSVPDGMGGWTQGWVESMDTCTTSGAEPKPASHLNPTGVTGGGGSGAGCGDFNSDGNPDFFLILEAGDAGNTPYRASIFLGNGDGTFDDGTASGHRSYELSSTGSMASDRTTFENMRWDSQLYVVDYPPADGRLDFLFVAETPIGFVNNNPAADVNTGTPGCSTAGSYGHVQLYRNVGAGGYTLDAARPTFETSTVLLCDLQLGEKGVSAVTYTDFNRDGVPDLAVAGVGSTAGSPRRHPIKLHLGLSGGGFDIAAIDVDAPAVDWPTGVSLGGANILLGADFTLDSYSDLIMATNSNGGISILWDDDGPAAYIADTRDQVIPETFTDFDMGFVIDYDNDPDATPDMLLADGNGLGYAVFANRPILEYIECGEVRSDVLDLGALDDDEIVITAARVEPSMILPADTSITFYLSNEEPPNWQVANPCADDPGPTSGPATTQPGDYCAAFPKATGRTIRWKAVMCSNPARTASPKITNMEIAFDYTESEEHIRGGVVVNDGVAYVGTFQQPGEKGHLYAANAALTTQYWDAGEILDGRADSLRSMYTTAIDGTTRLPFATSNAADPLLQETLGVASDIEASDVITWQRGDRFGIATDWKLGAVLLSTPAILSPPGRPYYYGQLSPVEKSAFESFRTSYQSRMTLVLFGSVDGALHAIRNDPKNITDPGNGVEAWAFIPHRIANGFLTDKTNGTHNSYPDASPTLADVKIGGSYRTVVVSGSGNGGKNFFALDVTDSDTSGPTPLWDVVPGGGNAGQSRSKAAVLRVQDGPGVKFIAVAATGVAYDNAMPPYAKGLDVDAFDMETGAQLWRFRAECPVSTDIVAFETDDVAEPGTPAIDGLVDRIVFADLCGNVYKLDTQATVNAGYITGMGSVDTGADDPNGSDVIALFSVATSAGALGEERPISGTVGIRPDDTGRVTAFFGTGGTETMDPTKPNAFYGIYVDTGEIRDSIMGTCNGTTLLCEKFYGGVVVTADQVLITRATDPPIATSSCDDGSAEIIGLDIADLSQEFSVLSGSSIISALFGDNGAMYAASLSGEVIRVGTPTVTDAGGTPAGGGPTPPTPSDKVRRRSWRQIL